MSQISNTNVRSSETFFLPRRYAIREAFSNFISEPAVSMGIITKDKIPQLRGGSNNCDATRQQCIIAFLTEHTPSPWELPFSSIFLALTAMSMKLDLEYTPDVFIDRKISIASSQACRLHCITTLASSMWISRSLVTIESAAGFTSREIESGIGKVL